MFKLLTLGISLFLVALFMTMVGKGGGNFYLVILTLAGTPIHEAATTSQFILFTASLAAMIVFQKSKSLSWHLVFFVGIFASLSALCGGYLSHMFSGFTLKIIFAAMLFLAGLLMLIKMPEKKQTLTPRIGIIKFKSGEHLLTLNLWIALPITILSGFFSGMVGVSGGSFLVPLIVIACEAPMHLAVGSASSLMVATSFMGFLGHAMQGDFNPKVAIPLAGITIIGGVIGSKFSLKTKSKHLKKIFAYTNWIAAGFMVIDALHSNGLM